MINEAHDFHLQPTNTSLQLEQMLQHLTAVKAEPSMSQCCQSWAFYISLQSELGISHGTAVKACSPASIPITFEKIYICMDAAEGCQSN